MSLQKEGSSDGSLHGSWVDLHFTGSSSQSSSQHETETPAHNETETPAHNETETPAHNETETPAHSQEVDLERLLLEAQHESGKSSSRGSSQCNSPLRAQTPLLVWRGSEGNSTQSDEDFQERRREVDNLLKRNADWIWDWSSRPENNPPKEFLLKHPKRTTSLSIRNTSVMKKGGILSADFLKLFLPSLIISHILAVGLGIYIGKRLTSHSPST